MIPLGIRRLRFEDCAGATDQLPNCAIGPLYLAPQLRSLLHEKDMSEFAAHVCENYMNTYVHGHRCACRAWAHARTQALQVGRHVLNMSDLSNSSVACYYDHTR